LSLVQSGLRLASDLTLRDGGGEAVARPRYGDYRCKDGREAASRIAALIDATGD
jgi:hypothetical protein